MARLSLHARLLLIAALTGVGALLFATFAIGHVLERFVLRGFDQTLDTQIHILERAVTPDGTLDTSQVVELPGFTQRDDPWVWRVRSPVGVWSGGATSLETNRVVKTRRRSPDGIIPGEGRTVSGERVHFRRLFVPSTNGIVEITTAGPRELIDRPLNAARGSLALSLALLALGLAAATWVQLRYGLRPVRDLRDAVARVRVGESDRLPDDQPRELRPLADEVNALVDQNRAGLEHARRHVANLAHGLKTPLATLSLRLAREGGSPETQAMVDQLDARIAHHLRRARSAAPSAGQRAHSSAASVISDVAETVQHIHADRALSFDIQTDGAVHLAIEQHDLEEIVGNLLDNACRHASHTVRIVVTPDAASGRIAIEDDGPGMTDAEIAQAMQAGVRLDESGVGYGFGLGIVQEMVALYGGTLLLGRSTALGGVAATILLPRASSGAGV